MHYQTKDLKLLYVENSEQTRKETIPILNKFFNKVIVAGDGEEALLLYKKENPDLIITDISIPLLSGIDFTKEIRKKDKDIPIIILSAHTDTEYLIESIKIGIDGYIFKPINLNQLEETLKKITERLSLKRELENNINLLKQYQEAVDRLFIVTKTDPRGIITYVNQKFCDISKYSKQELIGKPHNIVRHPDVPKTFFKNMWKVIKEEKRTWKGIVKNRAKDRSTYYVDTVITPIFDKNGEIKEYISIRKDITQIMNPRKKLENILVSKNNSIVAIINIDNFKYIEKIYDIKTIQDIENKILSLITKNIPEKCSFNEIVNFGDGEFVLAKDIKQINNRIIKMTINNLRNLQEKIQKASSEMLDYELDISVSIAYGKNAYKIAKYALTQMDKINTDFIMANELETKIKEEAEKNLRILKLIKSSIEKNRIMLYFQPIVSNKSGKIIKYESLIRLIKENGEVVSPSYFIDLAKKTKYYPHITSSVVEQAIEAVKLLNKEISINLSMIDIEKDNIRSQIISLIEKNKSLTDKITFEILEDENIKDFKVVENFLKYVKKLGVKIAIDDFGSGYSNFERLLNYYPDMLKIDGSLVKNIQNNRFSLNLIETIVLFAKRQRLKTIAEFVENRNIYEILSKLGVDYSQGFYFGKPEPIENLLKKYHKE